MFSLEGKLTFINIDQRYLKSLHSVCSEVFYKPIDYDNKPYIGILVNKNNRKYVNKECYLIYENTYKSCMSSNDIWITIEADKVKHILSVIDIKKMIPIVEGVYCRVDINPNENDTDDDRRYKDLLNKEYNFCLKIISEVIVKANKLYEKQVNTGKIAMFCCDFKALEKASDEWSVTK